MIYQTNPRKPWKLPVGHKLPTNLPINYPSLAFLGRMGDTYGKTAFSKFLDILICDLKRDFNSSTGKKMSTFIYGSDRVQALAPKVEFNFSCDQEVDTPDPTSDPTSDDERDPDFSISTASQSDESSVISHPPGMDLRPPSKDEVSPSNDTDTPRTARTIPDLAIVELIDQDEFVYRPVLIIEIQSVSGDQDITCFIGLYIVLNL